MEIMNLPKKNIEALKIISKKTENKNLLWVVIGSTNLAMQGVDVKANDIDILTDKKGALEFNKILAEFTVNPVEYKESEKFKSHIGLFKIKGVEVEIIGELKNKIPEGDLWSETTSLSKRTIIQFKGMKIPVIPLEQELFAYTKLGRKEKAEKIRLFLEKIQ